MSSSLFLPSALAAGLVVSADTLELADTIGFIDRKDFVALQTADDAALNLGATIIDPDIADRFEVAEQRKGTRLKTRHERKPATGNNRTAPRPTTGNNQLRVRPGDGKLGGGKLNGGTIDGRNDLIQGRDRCCTIEAN